MADLKLYLTDGFNSDRVVVSVNGKVVFDRNGVTTKKLYGLAEALQPIQVPADSANVEVSVPARNAVAKFDVNLSKGSHVPVTLEGDQLSHAVLKQIGFM